MFLPILAISAAAACGFTHEPPARYFTPDQPPVIAERVPMNSVADVCSLVGDKNAKRTGITLWGCSVVGSGRIIVPTVNTWPGTPECYRQNERHETAHARGWPADHPK